MLIVGTDILYYTFWIRFILSQGNTYIQHKTCVKLKIKNGHHFVRKLTPALNMSVFVIFEYNLNYVYIWLNACIQSSAATHQLVQLAINRR